MPINSNNWSDSFRMNNVPVIEDVIRVAEHLTGKQFLDNEDFIVADLNKDGQITAHDMQLMLRLVHDELQLPLQIPQIITAEPPVAGPGMEVSLECIGLGTNAEQIKAIHVANNHCTDVELNLIDETSCTIIFPVDIDVTENEVIEKLYLIREGVRSPAYPMKFSTIPVILSIEPWFANVGELITVKGIGFGSDIEGAEVFFNDLSFPPHSINDTEISINVPNDTPLEVDCAISIDGKRSKDFPFYRTFELNGIIHLPTGNTTQIEQLSVIVGEIEATPSSTGDFSIVVPSSIPIFIEVIDDEQNILLGAVLVDLEEQIQVGADSTAFWLITQLSGGYSLSSSVILSLQERLVDSAEFTQLVDKVVETLMVDDPKITALPANDEALLAVLELLRGEIS